MKINGIPITGGIILRHCAWCDTFIGFKSALGSAKVSVSHGMCKACFNKQDNGGK